MNIEEATTIAEQIIDRTLDYFEVFNIYPDSHRFVDRVYDEFIEELHEEGCDDDEIDMLWAEVENMVRGYVFL